MSLSRRLTAVVAAGAAAATLSFAGTAAAAFPDLSTCPRDLSNICIDIHSVGTGTLSVNRTSIPLATDSLRIRGGVDLFTSVTPAFKAPTSGDAVTSVANPVPGGLLGIDLPLPGNTVNASFELAGPTDAIRFDYVDQSIVVPVKIKLSNRYIGASCHIGSDAEPISLNLSASPAGTDRYDEATNILYYEGGIEIDNVFSVPSASGCGSYPSGTLVNRLVNRRLGLPSAAGRNSITLPVVIAIGAAV